MASKKWTREELIVAFNLYCKVPFSKINARNKEVRKLAPIIGRSDSAVSLKLANFARLDPDLQKRNISGMTHGSKGEVEIWKEFNENWDEFTWQSEQILARFKNEPVEKNLDFNKFSFPKEGKERPALIRQRVNQNFFRKMILASYDDRCCITRIPLKTLLVASHIIPWAVDKKNRMNPRNGLCLNVMHDKAFDKGLISVSPDYRIRISKKILSGTNSDLRNFFLPYKDKTIDLPQKFYPDPEFLKYHNRYIFKD